MQETRRCAWLRSPLPEALVAPNGSSNLCFLDMGRNSHISARKRAELTPAEKRYVPTVHLDTLNGTSLRCT